MELEELKANWNILNERLQKNEILNKRIVKDMITSRILTARERLMWKIIIGYCIYFACILLTAFSPVLFGTPLFMVYCLIGFMVAILLGGLPAFISFYGFNVENPLTDSFRRLLFYQKFMRLGYPIIVIAGLVLMTILCWDHWKFGANRITFVYVSAFLIAIVGSCVEYRWDSSKVEAMKKGLEELKEFEEEDYLE
ncbi:hypothetical protein [Parabacteroides timonensis]|uniref:hypothetical protein n=1 Tax=Parabacteroides timonensis TaxID=1871013 RepID=UPI00094EEF89|nr:hypothetical protein [Parabacteroides timonensis]